MGLLFQKLYQFSCKNKVHLILRSAHVCAFLSPRHSALFESWELQCLWFGLVLVSHEPSLTFTWDIVAIHLRSLFHIISSLTELPKSLSDDSNSVHNFLLHTDLWPILAPAAPIFTSHAPCCPAFHLCLHRLPSWRPKFNTRTLKNRYFIVDVLWWRLNTIWYIINVAHLRRRPSTWIWCSSRVARPCLINISYAAIVGDVGTLLCMMALYDGLCTLDTAFEQFID